MTAEKSGKERIHPKSEKRELGEIYVSMREGGRKAFEGEAVKTAPRDDPRATENFFLSVAFKPESEAKITAICDRIAEIAKQHDIPLVLAGRHRDFKPHATLQGGVLKSASEEERKKAYGEIYFDPEILREKENLAGATIDFKFVVAGNAAITLVATEIPSQITKFRARAKEVAKSQGVTVPGEGDPTHRDIMHITLARLADVPKEHRMEKLKAFWEAIDGLSHKLSRVGIDAREKKPGEPITLVVDHVFTAPVKRYAREERVARAQGKGVGESD